jgi:hypothetical protein
MVRLSEMTTGCPAQAAFWIYLLAARISRVLKVGHPGQNSPKLGSLKRLQLSLRMYSGLRVCQCVSHNIMTRAAWPDGVQAVVAQA